MAFQLEERQDGERLLQKKREGLSTKVSLSPSFVLTSYLRNEGKFLFGFLPLWFSWFKDESSWQTSRPAVGLLTILS